jgi:hypothetical protein
MSKLQFKKYVEKLTKWFTPNNWWRIPLLAPPLPARREFNGIPSGHLSDMVLSVAEQRRIFGFKDKLPLGEEFAPLFEEYDRLLQRALIELDRRGDLPPDLMTNLIRFVDVILPADQQELASYSLKDSQL